MKVVDILEGAPAHHEIMDYPINGKEVDISSIQLDGIDRNDYPDFADAYACSANFEDGSELNDEELEQLNSDYGEVINQLAHERMY